MNATKRATIYFDVDLHRAARMKAVETEKSVSDVVNSALRQSLAEDADDLAAFRDRARERNLDFEAFVKDLVSPDLTIDPYTVEELQVRIVGDTAFLSGTTRMTGRSEGKPFRTHYRYTDVYVRTAGKWKVCNVQTSRITD